ncbi:hypothetical protein NE237_021139 [Protea cynaroides]|uniref:Uncharacterized protein n=1 Tax=Protea cynaroides TaxID=273540 RepID=A0A9Q0H8K4_9MAGN|nr:hypothetical protein NE237_021139 [Protea cynaroides]
MKDAPPSTPTSEEGIGMPSTKKFDSAPTIQMGGRDKSSFKDCGPSTPVVASSQAETVSNLDKGMLSLEVVYELLEGIRLTKDVEFFESKEDVELINMIETSFLNLVNSMKVIMHRHVALQKRLSSFKKTKDKAMRVHRAYSSKIESLNEELQAAKD